MVASYRYPLALGLAFLTLAVATPRSTAQYATEIAITGVTIPGSSGNAFLSFDPPVINNVGQVAFLGFFPGGQGIFSVTGHPVNTIPSSTDNALDPNLRTQGATFPSAPLLNSIALTGNFAAAGQGILSAFTVSPPSNPSGVALNNTTAGNNNSSGQIAYLGQLNSNSLQAVFAATDPSITTPNTLALTNTPAAGFASNSGVTYTSLANPIALDDNNAVAFVASLSTGGQALYLGPTNNAPTLIAATGNAAGGAGNLFQSFTGPVQLVSIPNSSNNFLAFQAGIFNTVTGLSSSAIFVGSGTTTALNVTNVAQTGTNSPVTGTAGTYQYQNFVDPVSLGASGSGEVAFRANLVVPNTNPSAIAAGLFLATNGNAAVTIGATNALVGVPLPSGYSTTFPFGATYNGFGTPSFSLDGQLAFPATLAENNSVSGGAGGGGIFLSKGASTTVTHIAVSGDIAPGTGGASYASFFNDTNSVFTPIFNDTSVAINDHIGTNGSHEVAFQAYLAGTGVNGTNNQGLFIANDQLIPGATNQTETALLARTGEQLTVNPGVMQTIASFTGFNTRTGNGANSFNDLGELVANVNFVDGTSGIYVFTPDLHLSPFTVTTSTAAVSWGTAGTANSSWTFAYSPADQVYRIFIDPADVGLASITVNGPTANQSIPALQVSSNTGTANLVLQSSVTLTLGGGAITSGITVLTIQGPSNITTSGSPGTTVQLKLLGDVVGLAGSATATIAANFDLGNVPFPATAPNFSTPPPSTADVDRFRSFTVARGNFVGSYPIDLLISGNITSPSETITLSDGTTTTNDVHRGILKAGPGVLRLTGANTFGPDTTITDDPYTVTSPASPVSYVQSIEVTGGLLSFANDGNLGATPAAASTTNTAFIRWITLNGGGIGLMTTATSTLASPTVLNASRGIALGPVTGFGNGSIDVFGTNVLDYEGIISDDSNGTTTGVGSLTKTGSGTLILSGTANTYRGGTTVNQGTLLVAGDGTLGAAGTPVTVSGLGTLTYTGSATTARPFTLNGGTLSVAAGHTVTFNNTTVFGGQLAGPGTFATSAGGSTAFSNNTIQPGATVVLNGFDALSNVSQNGQLTVAGGPNAVATLNNVTNQGSGSITIGAGSQANVSGFQTYGTLTLVPNTSSVPTILTNTGTSPLFFNGGSQTFIGTPATADPTGQNIVDYIDLHGNNAIVSGGLLVNNGGVFDTIGAGTGTIISEFGALVKGAGFYQNGVRTQNGGKFQTGNSPGSATFGNFVFGPGGVNNYIFAIDDAAGTAGPSPGSSGMVSGWGLIKAVQASLATGTTSGNFTWTATPSNPLTVAIDTLVNPTMVGTDVSGPMADFNPTQPYSWLAARWSGTYAGPTDVAMLDADTSFDTSGIVNPIAGSFGWSLDPTNQTLSLIYTPSAVPEPGTLALVGLAALAGWRWRRRGFK